VEPASLRPDAALRDELDIDSMDFLNFVIALHEQLGVDIPEVDYSKLSSINDIVAYLASKLGSSPIESP
jgi:acyl carrier protein